MMQVIHTYVHAYTCKTDCLHTTTSVCACLCIVCVCTSLLTGNASKLGTFLSMTTGCSANTNRLNRLNAM